MMKHLFHAPRLWASDPHNHRRVTWIELFFDLIFVACVAQVGEPLAEDYSPAGLFRYAFLSSSSGGPGAGTPPTTPASTTTTCRIGS